MRRDSLTRWLGAVGVLGAIVFWAALAVLHDLRPDLSVLDDYVSDYANGSGGTLFTLAVLAHGAGNVAIAAGLRRDLGRGRVAGLGVLAFAVAAVGFILAGVFPTDPAGASTTVTGWVHRGAVTGSFAVELVALVLLAPVFRARPAWRDHLPLSLSLTVAAAVALLWLVVGIANDWVPGLAERSALAAFTVWEFATALRIALAAPGRRPATDRAGEPERSVRSRGLDDGPLAG